MSDTETPAVDTQEQQEAVVEGGGAVGDVAANDVPAENGEKQETQETQEEQAGGDGDDAKAEGDDNVAAEVAEGGDGDGGDAAAAETKSNGDGDEQQTAQTAEGEQQAAVEEERQPTPATQVEEPSEQQTAECNGGVEEPEAGTPEAESDTSTEPPEPEPQAEEAPQEPEVQLSEEQMKRCRHYFDKKAVDDRLDLKGFKGLCRIMGEVLSAADAEVMFEEGDRDDNGTIEFEEFCRLYCKHSEEEQSRKTAMMDSIDKLFPSSDGQPVELKKVKNLLLKMQRPNLDMRLVREKSDLNPGDIHRLVKSMDSDGNGLISKQEFVDTLCKHLDHA